ncbi:MAG: hypothetical protein WD847_17610 [Pirellulales bacterium]
MANEVEKLIEEFRALPPEDQRRVRSALEPSTTCQGTRDVESLEQVFKQRLLDAGLITEITQPARDRNSFDSFRPVSIRGKPLSETIIEERR